MHPALAGRPVVRFEAPRTPRPWPATGTVVTRVEARGKHLLVHFEDGWTLQTHMRMTGSWHLYRPGERWRKAPHLARAIIEVGPRQGPATPTEPTRGGWPCASRRRSWIWSARPAPATSARICAPSTPTSTRSCAGWAG